MHRHSTTVETPGKKKKMNINELTIGEAKEISKLFGGGHQTADDFPFKKGSVVLIRTVTMIQIGTIEEITQNFLTLSNGGWVADTGRFGECIANGTLNEFEKVPNTFGVNRGSIVDVFLWPHVVPSASK